ncbi:MAG: SDR family oxidoreductase [Gammaproteobacteria bacterium]|nr:SDR family oxidoreductase [Gammaproteobacteria bacterium]NND39597.1 SDR family oxidoreductase [Pseudomonadales bacterium]NNL11404.1 SDR family oxidoreductase [Pseudomonadales bacterium]NNM11502.1 SDR family oxidoreductase [Pseudomonadales bacterium]RZV56349.1 MAG: SDR family oxidoreductase [Pseudomonadales bacterium]
MSYELTGMENKVALVTGAGRMRGIGRAIALELARAGCDIVITGSGRPVESYPDDEKVAGWRDINSVADEVRALGRRALALVSNVADLDSVYKLADSVFAEFGRTDFVINNAGAARAGDRVPVVELAPDAWRKIIDVNLNGSFYMSKVFGAKMIEQGQGGAIINISSIGGKLMAPTTAAYAASKAGLHALTCAMAGEVGEHNIRVNAVCPGIVMTSRLDDMSPEQWEGIINSYVPLKRAGQPESIGSMVAYLCSEQGSWVSGQLYSVDGGQLAGR